MVPNAFVDKAGIPAAVQVIKNSYDILALVSIMNRAKCFFLSQHCCHFQEICMKGLFAFQ